MKVPGAMCLVPEAGDWNPEPGIWSFSIISIHEIFQSNAFTDVQK